MKLSTLLRWLTIVAVGLGLLALILALAPGPAYAAGVLSLATGFGLLFPAALGAGVLAVLAGLGGAVLGLIGLRRKGLVMWNAVAVAAGLAVVLSILNFRAGAQANPIHDVTTDLDMPPRFELITPRNYDTGRPDYDERARALSYPHPDWRSTHESRYGDIQAVGLSASLTMAVERVRAVAADLGWEIVGERRGGQTEVVVEATVTTGWFQFKDDVSVRLTDAGDGVVVVDARSVSRIGLSDIGANAARLRRFLSAVQS